MGFFSTIKKLFGQNRKDEQPIKDAARESVDQELEVSPKAVESGHASVESSESNARPLIPGEQEKSPGQYEPADVEESGAEAARLARLRQAEPKLSAWLDIVLENVDTANDLLWTRLQFLFNALEAPPDESSQFIEDFRNWLEKMDYQFLDEFRSELQYRLALALELEDEEDERNRLFLQLSQSLARTREQLGQKLNALFSSQGELDDKFWEELEELLITADFGYESALEMVERLKSRARKNNVREISGVADLLKEEIAEIFIEAPKIKAVNKPEVVLMIGVNGAGKTTTIAKLAYRARLQGKKTLIAAADTFRAAAIDQLGVWAKRVGSDFYSRPEGSDPAAVAWGAMEEAQRIGADIVFIDTAGRLQTKVNLMEELGKIRQVLAKKHAGAPHRSVLVLDATTGQNALSQARLFREAAGADEIILTKLDGTAKGGVAIAVAMREKLPITFIGLGEKMEDLRPFSGDDFAKALLEDARVESGKSMEKV